MIGRHWRVDSGLFFFFNDELDWFLDLQYGQSRKIRSLEATQGGVMLTWFRMMAVEELKTGLLGCILTREQTECTSRLERCARTNLC